jgi:hypothetical protein
VYRPRGTLWDYDVKTKTGTSRMTQDQASDVRQRIRAERPDCIVVARRMTDWNGAEWWYVQVEHPQEHTVVAVTSVELWHSVLSSLI